MYFRTNVLVFVGKEQEKKSIFKTNGVTAVLRLPEHLTNERFKWGEMLKILPSQIKTKILP